MLSLSSNSSRCFSSLARIFSKIRTASSGNKHENKKKAQCALSLCTYGSSACATCQSHSIEHSRNFCTMRACRAATGASCKVWVGCSKSVYVKPKERFALRFPDFEGSKPPSLLSPRADTAFEGVGAFFELSCIQQIFELKRAFLMRWFVCFTFRLKKAFIATNYPPRELCGNSLRKKKHNATQDTQCL